MEWKWQFDEDFINFLRTHLCLTRVIFQIFAAILPFRWNVPREISSKYVRKTSNWVCVVVFSFLYFNFNRGDGNKKNNM